MKYVDRRGTSSLKWDSLEQYHEGDLLSMWVADMDFASPECAIKAVKEYLDRPQGYFLIPDSYYDAVIRWEKEQHDYEVKKEWIRLTPGVVPAVFWAVRAFTSPGDGVMVSTPVYYPFMDAVENCEDRKLVKNELKRENGRYLFDFDRFEDDIVKNHVTLYILCNPHNPIGRVWTREELTRIMEICRRRNVRVIADEIHQDIINPKLGRRKVTAATVGDYDDLIITMASASKTFNLAALKSAFTIIPDDRNRECFDSLMVKYALDYTYTNPCGIIATEEVFRNGKPWMEEALDIIYGNYEYLCKRFADECPDVTIGDLEGTYLAWMDFGKFCHTTEELEDLTRHRCKIALDSGGWFGSDDYQGFGRMNLATSRENVKVACDRLIGELNSME